MGSIARGVGSVGISIAAGCAFATAAALSVPEASIFFDGTLLVGGVIGFITSPTAVYALALPDCRPSFASVFWPTLLVTFVGSMIGWPFVAMVLSVPIYVGLCLIAGTVAFHRRRHLRWFNENRCPQCGYDMRGLDGVTCPECGRDTTGLYEPSSLASTSPERKLGITSRR